MCASLIVGGLWGLWHLPLYLIGLDRRPLSLFPAFVLSVVAASVVCTWMYNGTGGSLLIVALYRATANLPLTVFLEPLGGRAAQPFLVYVALSVVTAVAIVLATGPEHLSRTHRQQATTP
ncbi:MAG TPA: CPBP family glutamic-type intramembrane protease [Propionibacteriaceae bacterium]|nr:CPBP family glutamic-type intramembrane protease [Propionibacteriaceae bacterium]